MVYTGGILQRQGVDNKARQRQNVVKLFTSTEMDTTGGVRLEPDSSEVNQLDWAASQFFIGRCQTLGIPLVMVPREVSRSITVSSAFFDALAGDGSASGPRIRNAIREEMNAAWRQACEFDESDQNVSFTNVRQDKGWFCQTYCQGLGMETAGFADTGDSIWDLLTTIDAPHAPLALLASVPSLRDRFFQSTAYLVKSRERTIDDSDSPSVLAKHLVVEEARPEAKLGEYLLSSLSSGLSLEQTAAARACVPSLIIISDAGQDLDDEMTLILLRDLTNRGFVECKGVIATLAPSRARARLIRGTLDSLGLGEVPVAVGSDGGFSQHTATFEDTARSYIAPDDDSFSAMSGQELLMQVYSTASPASLDLLCLASLKDAADFARAHEELLRIKLRA